MPLLVSEVGGLACEKVGKADLMLDHFDSKQSRVAVHLPLTCHPSPSLTTFALWSREVRRLLSDLDPCGGTFSAAFRVGSFPACRRKANITQIPKGLPSSSVVSFRPISITSV